MKPHHRALLGLAALFLCSCATLSKPYPETKTKVLETRHEDKREEGSLVVDKLEWQGDLLRAEVKRQMVCTPITRAHIQRQKWERRNLEAGGLLANGLMGGACLTGGLAAFAIAPFLSNQAIYTTDSGQKISDRMAAITWGIIGVLFSLYPSYAVLSAFFTPREKALEGPKETWEEKPAGEAHDCERRDPGPGFVTFEFAGGPSHSARVEGGSFAFDVLSMRAELCSDPAMHGRPLSVAYVAEYSRDAIPLGEYDARACIDATTARSAIERMEKLFEGQAGMAEVAQVAGLIERAEAGLNGLPDEHREKKDLVDRCERARTKSVRVAAMMIDQALKDFRGALSESGPEGALVKALLAIELAKQREDLVFGVWSKVYRAYVKAAVDEGSAGISAIRSLVDRDETTAGCLGETEACPAWLDSAKVRAALKPASVVFERQAKTAMPKLRRAAQALEKKPTLDAWTDYVAALEEARSIAPRCPEVRWSQAAIEACGALGEEIASAERIAAEREPVIRKLRAKALAVEWRKNFKLCRQVAEARQMTAQITDCDERCQALLRQIEEDADKTRAFVYEPEVMTDSLLSKLRDACEAAQCPRCP